jgi:hypothetical protein
MVPEEEVALAATGTEGWIAGVGAAIVAQNGRRLSGSGGGRCSARSERATGPWSVETKGRTADG